MTVLGGRQFSVLSADVGFGRLYILVYFFVLHPLVEISSCGAKWKYLTHFGPRDLRP
jgi:hypothetical protein